MKKHYKYCFLVLMITVAATSLSWGQFTYQELLPPGWTLSMAWDINENGIVVGEGTDSTGTHKGFIYSGGTYTEILPPGWGGVHYVYSINNNGDVIGQAWNSSNSLSSGYLYMGGNYIEIIPPGWSSPDASANSINLDFASR